MDRGAGGTSSQEGHGHSAPSSRAECRRQARPSRLPSLTADKVSFLIANGRPASRDVPVTPRFQAGQQVRARNMHPVGHTRLPRYVRARLGTIERDHGVFVFPDTNAHFLGEKPQHVYSVRFAARELWGEQAAPARFCLSRSVGRLP